MGVPARRTTRSIWYDRDGRALHVNGTEHPVTDIGFLIHSTELGAVTATDLRHAFEDLAEDLGAESLYVSDVQIDQFDDDYTTPVTDVVFSLTDDRLVVDIAVEVDDWMEDDDAEQLIDPTVADLLLRGRADLVSVSVDPHFVSPYRLHIVLGPRTRARSLLSIYELGVAVGALVKATISGGLTLETAIDLLRAGQGAALIGQPEGQWLDVKTALYDLKGVVGKVSLAEAVARFANSVGGLVVFGMETKKSGSGEVVHKLHPVPVDGYTVRKHRQVLEQHLYPLPSGLQVEIVQVGTGEEHLLLVHLPEQPDTAKPFLVHGAIVGGKGQGAFISIVRRHGEDSIPITAAAVHSAMSINRLLDRLEGPLSRRGL